MTLFLYELDNCRENILESNSILVIEIEKPQYMANIIRALRLHAETTPIALFDNNKRLNVEREVCVLIDYFQENELSKSVFTKLQDKLLQEDNFEYKLDFNPIVEEIDSLINKIISSSLINFDWDRDIEPKDFFKLMGLKIAHSLDILENCLNFITICATMKLYKIIVFTNLKSFITQDKIIKLYRHCLYCGQLVLFIDSQHYEKMLDYERKVYIDNDFFDMKL